jgi:hypothetical protein
MRTRFKLAMTGVAALLLSAAAVQPPFAQPREWHAGHGTRGAGALGIVDPANIRVLLFRSYLPTGGRDAVPLPSITLVRDDRKATLQPCPRRADSVNANFEPVRQAFARSDISLDRILRAIARAALVPLDGIVRNGLPFCAWWTVTDVDNFNIAFPDAAATYWAMPFLVNLQDEVIVEGVYPNERYLSLALYNQFLDPYTYTDPASGQVFPSYLADFQINPDDGSQNPWQVETEPGGHFTVTIKKQPQAGETNVLPFLESPEDSLGLGGSFPLPPPCNTPESPFPCTLDGMFVAPLAAAQSSVFSNPDNTYLPTLLDFDPADRVFVVRGKLPVTPPGTSPTPWPDPSFDMRYWSMCNAIYARPYPTIADGGCVADEDVVLDDNGFYTIAVSTEDARPSNATADNGVTWLRGIRGVRNLLILRNMLPVDFQYAAQNVTKDGSWQTAYNVMQDYYPTITVACTTAHFEANGWQGCVAPKGVGAEFGPGVPGAGGP